MKKTTVVKIAGVVTVLAGILGIVAHVSNQNEKREYLDDDNEYIKFGSSFKVASGKNIYKRYIKRVLDVILSASGLVILSPVFAVISVIIFIDDPGPVIFKQKRVGKDCKLFYCHKFRTMKMSTPHDVPTHQLTDPCQYITRVGKVLRRTSLDEILQCWDIFRNKMSVIGPRPALWNQDDLVAERAKYGANNVMPGLTGLAQISGRDELEISEKARIDGEYVKNIGFWTDCKCFFGTVKSVLEHDGVVEGGTGSKSVSRPIEPVKPEDVGFEDYGWSKTFNIDKAIHKNVLITGEGSYIGESFKSYVESHYPNIECLTIDMVDDIWREFDFSGYDTVFHVAGIAHVDVGHTPLSEQEKYYEVNTDLAIECCEKAKDDGVKQFIFMGSMIIYGGTKYIDEYTLPFPLNFYGNSKWLADKGVRALADERFKVAVLRTPMIYGKGSKGNYPMLARIAKRTPIFPDVNNKRSILYIENLCEFVAQLSLSGGGGVFFPQNGETASTNNIVKSIAKVSNHKLVTSKLLNPAVIMAQRGPIGKIQELAEKAFGSSWYDQGLSQYKGLEYQKVTLEESIRRTEG